MAKLQKVITNQTPVEELHVDISDLDAPAPEEIVVPEEEPETIPEPEEEDLDAPVETTPQTNTPTKEEPSSESQEDIDWKARYSGSTKEAQILAAREKEWAKSVEEASNLPEPTEEDLHKEYGDDWEVMDGFQKKIAKDNLLNKLRFQKIDEVAQKRREVDKWTDKVNEFTSDPSTVKQIPRLQGREAEFAQFCSLPTRIGVDFDVLVKAFLYDVKTEVPQRSNKTLFDTTGGGEAPKPQGITPEQAEFLRKNNQREYKRLVKEGKIDFEL